MKAYPKKYKKKRTKPSVNALIFNGKKPSLLSAFIDLLFIGEFLEEQLL